MGIYVFNAAVSMEAPIKNAADEGSRHSIGGDIIPMLVGGRAAHVYDFWYSQIPGVGTGDRGYWRDVGTGDSCFDAHMDLYAVQPVFTSTTAAGRF